MLLPLLCIISRDHIFQPIAYVLAIMNLLQFTDYLDCHVITYVLLLMNKRFVWSIIIQYEYMANLYSVPEPNIAIITCKRWHATIRFIIFWYQTMHHGVIRGIVVRTNSKLLVPRFWTASMAVDIRVCGICCWLSTLLFGSLLPLVRIPERLDGCNTMFSPMNRLFWVATSISSPLFCKFVLHFRTVCPSFPHRLHFHRYGGPIFGFFRQPFIKTTIRSSTWNCLPNSDFLCSFAVSPDIGSNCIESLCICAIAMSKAWLLFAATFCRFRQAA